MTLKQTLLAASIVALLSASVLAAEAAGTKPASRPASAPASMPSPVSSPASVPADDELSAADVNAAIARLEQDKDLDAAARARAMELYRLALEQIKAADEWAAKAASFARMQEEAPGQLASLQAKLLESNEPMQPIDANLPLAQLEQLAAQAQAQSAAAARETSRLDDEPKRRNDRRAEIPQLLINAMGQNEEVARKLAAPAPPQEAPEVTAASTTLANAQRLVLRRQMQAFRSERNAYEATQELVGLQRDVAAARLTRAQKYSRALQDAVAQRRQAEVQRVAMDAQRAVEETATLHPVAQRLARENSQLAQSRIDANSAASGLERARQDFDRTVRELSRLRGDFKSIKEKVEAVGLSNNIGLLLRRQRGTLPDLGAVRRQITINKGLIAQTQMEYLELAERRKALNDLDAAVAEQMGHLQSDIPEPQRLEIQKVLRKLLQARRQYLDLLAADCNSYSAKLLDLTASMGWLADETQRVQQYIDERVLWIRSAPPLYSMNFRELAEGARWLVDPAAWTALARRLGESALSNPVSTAAGLLLTTGLLVLRRRLQNRLTRLGEQVSRKPERFGQTLGAMTLTLLIVGLVPGILAALALVLQHNDQPTELMLAVAEGLKAVAMGYLTAEVVIQTCRPHGLAHAHFHWPAKSVNVLQRMLKALMALSLPILFLVAVMEGQGVESRKDTLGRVFFIAGLCVLEVFAWRLLKPSGAVMQAVLDRPKGGWLHRLRGVWYGLALLTPLALAGTAFAGYYYSSFEIAGRMLASLWLVLGLLVAYAVVDRGISVARRLATRSQAMTRLSAMQERRTDGSVDGIEHMVAEASPDVGPADMRKQSRRLLQYLTAVGIVVGLWAIWAQVVPALSVLKHVELGSYVDKAQVLVARPDGSTASQAVDRRMPVTLLDAIWAAAVLALTLAAVRNIPGLLQMALLQRLRLDSGAIYAITTITRYAIIITGIVVAFSLIGVSWSQVQWLAAAMTVGLGFGLQEIFANFVSGLIILFERPMRVGDVITVGDVRGVVSKIRIRATTIVDRDHKELIVPNKAFITDKLVNWTLTDTMLRLVVPVNIALGPEPAKVEAMLEDLARRSPDTLRDPPPQVFMVSVGANAMRMEVRVFVPDLDTFRRVRNQLLIAIEEMCRQAGFRIV